MEQDAFLTFLDDHAAAARNFSPTDALLTPIFERLGRWDSVAEKATIYTNLGLWKLHDQTTHTRPITWEPIGLLVMGSVSDLGESCFEQADGKGGGGGGSSSRFYRGGSSLKPVVGKM